MRQLIFIVLTVLSFSVFGQNYPFAKDFVSGVVVFKDSSQKKGQVKWFPDQNEKLKFRETENGKTIKYPPEEIMGFSADTFKFVSLYNFDVYSENYSLLGKTSHIKHTFGQQVDSGKFNIYLVFITGYNAISSSIQTYPNFLFQKKDNDSSLVAYPFAIRMKDKKFEKAKENLYVFFKDYPDIVQKIKNYKQQDNFFEIISLIKTVNRQ
jgi:hypothetical protein